jgi:hypothetical protein
MQRTDIEPRASYQRCRREYGGLRVDQARHRKGVGAVAGPRLLRPTLVGRHRGNIQGPSGQYEPPNEFAQPELVWSGHRCRCRHRSLLRMTSSSGRTRDFD